jgi:glycosyltransferase involved in cell wall biosynthesis
MPYPYAANEGYLAIPSESKGKVVGFVGRLERRKGIEIFANAIPRILDADPSASVRLVGQPVLHVSGQLYDEWLRRRLRKYMSRIEILGKVPLDKMHEVYAGLDICVFPSIWENFPNVCLEAMSAGRAIVASDGGGMREMLDNGRCGSIVPSGDYRSLASAVVALLQDVDQRNRFGAMAGGVSPRCDRQNDGRRLSGSDPTRSSSATRRLLVGEGGAQAPMPGVEFAVRLTVFLTPAIAIASRWHSVG